MFYSLHDQYEKIYRYCYFKVKDGYLAEDLTQETFLRYLGQTSYEDRGKPLAYLYTIAKNLCADYFRKGRDEPLPDTLPAKDELSAIETGLAVRKAVGRLPEEEGELLLLRYGAELSMGEIAALTGLSRFSIRRRLDRAVKVLAGELEKGDFS